MKSSGPPSAEHMAKMGALIEKFSKDGTLVTTGPLGKSGPCGAKVRLQKGDVTVTHGPFSDSVLMGASRLGVGTTRIFCHAFRRESANVCHSLSHAENGCCAPN